MLKPDGAPFDNEERFTAQHLRRPLLKTELSLTWGSLWKYLLLFVV